MTTEKKPMATWKKIVIGVFAFYVVAKIVNPPLPNSRSQDSIPDAEASQMPQNSPKEEIEFIKLVSAAQINNMQASNDMQRGGIKNTRDKAVCKLLRKMKAKDWVGQVSEVNANSDGKGVLGIKIADKVTITTWNNAFSDLEDHTLLEPGTEFFNTVSQFKIGQTIKFSGTFARSDSSGECIKESSLTLEGKIADPDFIFRFGDISTF